ncbi:AbrB/MazE/SpoVT family DNA-binding domain-containing protein [Nocardioides sp.]|uniref:AbrB/MazE/SpoVT family DNA-binding domain-containing protein n=1 Tax=Nocardioides sp. TaxID=35761 RepID=UPI0039E45E36
MTHMYATITSKGQITLPVAARRALGLRDGQKVEVRVQGNSLVIDAPPDIDVLRKRAREEAEANGTWGKPPTAGEGWPAHVANDYDEHGRRKP